MEPHEVVITLENGDLLIWSFSADDALHAIEQFMERGVLDPETVVTHIEARKIDTMPTWPIRRVFTLTDYVEYE